MLYLYPSVVMGLLVFGALAHSHRSNSPPQSSYKTYYFNQDPLTLYEDQTTISKGTTGLVTWFVGLRLHYLSNHNHVIMSF